jgi:two-component system, NtrC family, nitrogen regulation response regulator GlnG
MSERHTKRAAAPSPLIWIVEDDRSIRFVLEHALADAGIQTRSFADAESALVAAQEPAIEMPDAVFTDVRMPGMDGLSFLSALKSRANAAELPVVVMSAYTDLSSTVAAFDGGAFDFLPKPFDLSQALDLAKRALSNSVVKAQTEAPKRVDASVDAGELIGQTPAMQEVFRAIGKLSKSQLSVLITGETGTGKELIARALHRHSLRHRGPFVAINTAAIAADLLESELFGHEQGAFTGASRRHVGRFEQANGGTLFLDEIGDMPMPMQSKLLRVLAEGEFFPVGARTLKKCDVRVLTATHRDLSLLVASGEFRADLLHRLNVIQLRLPPLRERLQDLPALCTRFLQVAAEESGSSVKRLSPAAALSLAQYHFPGNVRELRNLCQRLAALAPGDVILESDLALPEPVCLPRDALLETRSDGSSIHANDDWLSALRAHCMRRLQQGDKQFYRDLEHDFERTVLSAALDACQQERKLAAETLGVGRNAFARKL